jgi:hypothetical protein
MVYGLGLDRTVLALFFLHISCIPSLGVRFSFGLILVFSWFVLLMVAPRFLLYSFVYIYHWYIRCEPYLAIIVCRLDCSNR